MSHAREIINVQVHFLFIIMSGIWLNLVLTFLGRPGQHDSTKASGSGSNGFLTFKAGNQVGEAFWNMLLLEHGLDQSGVSLNSRLQL